MSLQRVLLTTGGTGGHIFPALAVVEELRRRSSDTAIAFIGGTYGPEADLAVRAGLDFAALPVRGIFGHGFKALGGGFRMLAGIGKAMKLIRHFNPQVVIGFGGYAAFAAVFAASLSKRPCAIHEQNAIPGAANKLLAKRVNKVFISLPDASKAFKAEKTTLTGNPVRASIVELGRYLLDHPRPHNANLLIMGGSQGASAVNTHILEILPALRAAGVRIWHQTGIADCERIRRGYVLAGMEEARVEGFINNIDEAYAWANLAVCRAGATSVAELAIAGLPSLIIPFPQATHNHQLFNARQLEQAGAAILVEQKNLAAADLGRLLPQLLSDRSYLEAMSRAARELAVPLAAQALVNELEALASTHEIRQ